MDSGLIPSALEWVSAILFGIAILHTFSVKQFQHFARRYPEGSIGENFFHLLGEVEIVFGLWAAILVVFVMVSISSDAAVQLVESRNFTEPLFVFAIMTIAATRPVIALAQNLILSIARLLPLAPERAFLLTALTVGPLLGSLITEPAAMTLTALILRAQILTPGRSERFKYAVLGTLFVNVSIGGVLTHFAAPPVLMVARVWNWDALYMFSHFGWKAILACITNAGLLLLLHRKNLGKPIRHFSPAFAKTPIWLGALHCSLLMLVVVNAHHPAIFIGLLLLFLGLAEITKEHQDNLKVKESLLVAFFLAGLVVLGSQQSWWLKPLVASLSDGALFLGATALTAVTDNAALTYLGSLIPDTSESFRYALVAGAITGGGLTVIANAPNPAGYAILKDRFGVEGISPGRLFLGAALPTLVAMIFLWGFK